MTTGTWPLIRLILRRERFRIGIWSVGLVAMVAISAESVKGFYPTQESLEAGAESARNPAVLAFQGPDQALDTIGGRTALEIGAPGLVFMGLMALLMTGRMTRAEEEAGRFELVRALPVAHQAPLLAAGSVVAAMSVAIGGVISISLVALDLPVAGSVNYGLGWTMVGLVFAAITMLTAQVTENSRLANGLAGCALGASFALRAVGDMSEGPLAILSWLSPIGWAQGALPFAGERWWPLALGFAVAAGIAVLAFRTSERRDLGGGLVAPRPGPATGSERLASPFALAVRLQRGALVGWTAGTAFLALVYGAITNAVEDFVDDSPEIAEFLQAIGGNLIDSYVATAARITALIGTGFAVQSILRIRSEETNDRTEPILATPVSRRTYWTSHLAFTAIGTVVVLGVSGLVLGVAAAISVGDASLVWGGLTAMATYFPAVLVLVGISATLIGLVPHRSALSWVALAAAFLVAMFGTLLDLPSWAMRISPYENLTRVPAEAVGVFPTVTLLVIAGLLLGAGFAGYLRRDLPA